MAIKFNRFIVDPPWKYADRRLIRKDGGKARFGIGAAGRYNVMELEDLQFLDIDAISEENSVMFLWTTLPYEIKAMIMMECFWNHKYTQSQLEWVKLNRKSKTAFFGPGHRARANKEVCLIGIKGNVPVVCSKLSQIMMDGFSGKVPLEYQDDEGNIDPPSFYNFAFEPIQGGGGWNFMIGTEIMGHSRKPDIHPLVEMMFGKTDKQVELFARRSYPGWTTTGLECDGKSIQNFIEECKNAE